MTDSPGTASISDASNMRVKGQRSLNFGSKFRFLPVIKQRMLYSDMECGRKDIIEKQNNTVKVKFRGQSSK